MRWKKRGDEVLFAAGSVVQLTRATLRRFKDKARRAPRRRFRLCAHRSTQERVHEMLIIMPRGAYVRPHKHLRNPESIHVVEGRALLFEFDNAGRVVKTVPLGDYRSERRFYYKLYAPRFHTLLIESKFLVFHETRAGPFLASDTLPATWAPDERNPDSARRFVRRLEGLRVSRRNRI